MRIFAITIKLCAWIIFFGVFFTQHPVDAKEGDVTDIPTAIEEIFPTATRIGEPEPDIPVIPIYQLNELLGYAFESQHFANFMGFSGEPINILISLDPKGVIL